MSQALYDAVKSGQVQLSDLNDAGKETLRNYMNNLPSQSTAEAGKERFGVDVLHPENSPMMQAVQSNNEANPNPTQTPSLAESVQKPNFLDKIFKDNPVARVLNYPFAKAAQDSVPDANYLGTNVNARQDFAQRTPIPSTGSPTLDKVG